jgi:hypothetical protein
MAAIGVDIFANLRTAGKELKEMKRGTPYIEPRMVAIDADNSVGSFDIGQLLARRLQHDAKCRQRCRAKSDEWMRGNKWKQLPSDTLADFDDGVAARWHPHLMRPATADELPIAGGHGGDIRIALDLNADDIEVVICRSHTILPC